jgi:hypothetical protein
MGVRREVLLPFYTRALWCPTPQFDVSKIPDIYDVLKYYLIHNAHLSLPGVAEIYPISKALADVIVPQEYGITPEEKKELGSKICHNLLKKILFDLQACEVSWVAGSWGMVISVKRFVAVYAITAHSRRRGCCHHSVTTWY